MKKLFLYLNLCFVIGCAQTDLSDRNDIAIIDTRGVDESVFKKDYSECSDFAKNIEHELMGKSPTSLKITFKQINEATEMSLRDALIMEYRMVQRCQASGDFYEGVRAMLVDKDRKPNWKPSDLNKVDEIWVNHFFEPLHEKDLKI